jgi:hypothetical protein
MSHRPARTDQPYGDPGKHPTQNLIAAYRLCGAPYLTGAAEQL